MSSRGLEEYNVLQFGGTIDLVQDIDQFRQAIGASKMSIYGMSYGSRAAHGDMNHSLNSLKGFIGTTIGVIKGDTRRLDSSSHDL